MECRPNPITRKRGRDRMNKYKCAAAAVSALLFLGSANGAVREHMRPEIKNGYSNERAVSGNCYTSRCLEQRVEASLADIEGLVSGSLGYAKAAACKYWELGLREGYFKEFPDGWIYSVLPAPKEKPNEFSEDELFIAVSDPLMRDEAEKSETVFYINAKSDAASFAYHLIFGESRSRALRWQEIAFGLKDAAMSDEDFAEKLLAAEALARYRDSWRRLYNSIKGFDAAGLYNLAR